MEFRSSVRTAVLTSKPSLHHIGKPYESFSMSFSSPTYTLNLPTKCPDASSPSPSWPPSPLYKGNTLSQSSKWLNSSSKELL